MPPIHSKMTSGEFIAWCRRHDVNYRNCSERIDIHRRTYFRYVAGTQAIPYMLVMLCNALDLIHDYESVKAFTLTPRQLADICAHTTKRCCMQPLHHTEMCWARDGNPGPASWSGHGDVTRP